MLMTQVEMNFLASYIMSLCKIGFYKLAEQSQVFFQAVCEAPGLLWEAAQDVEMVVRDLEKLSCHFAPRAMCFMDCAGRSFLGVRPR